MRAILESNLALALASYLLSSDIMAVGTWWVEE